MNSTPETITCRLGYAGLLPFILLCLLYANDKSAWSVIAFSAYSACILSFLAGSLWGQLLNKGQIQQTNILYLSNLFSLLAWAALLLVYAAFVKVALLLLTLGYGAMLAVEYFLLMPDEKGKESLSIQKYKGMRLTLTYIVMACHVLILII